MHPNEKNLDSTVNKNNIAVKANRARKDDAYLYEEC